MARREAETREAEIVQAAIAYFAEAGFGGTTRELAQRIGISQPLLYRYFPTKGALVDRVYAEVFDNTWRPEWDALLDGDGPADGRIIAFYADYTTVIFQPFWLRLFLLSGLRGYDMPTRFNRLLRGKVYRRIVGLLRADMELPEAAPTEAEIEAVWGLHGSLVYLGIRQSVFHMRMPLPMAALAEQHVRIFLGGFRALLAAEAKRLTAERADA